MIVLPVRIIMSPTSSSKFLTGKNPRSATLRTTWSPPVRGRPAQAYATAPSHANRQLIVRCLYNESTRRFWRPGTFPPAMGMGRRATALAALVALGLAGCGGGERQDKNEPSGTFDVRVVDASFPTAQHIAARSRMRIAVRNTGSKAIPNVAVTVKGFSRRDPQQGLADPNKPVGIVDTGPAGRGP